MMDANNMLEDNGLSTVPGTMRIFPNGSSEFTDNDFTQFHLRVLKLHPDSFYQSEINKMLQSEYSKRSSK